MFDVHSLKQICLKFYKSILKVPQTYTNAAVYSELGCLPISLDASKSVIKFYFRLLQQPVPNIMRDALKLSQDLSKACLPSWYFKLERSLLSLGFDMSLIGEHTSYDTIITRLQDQHIQWLYCRIQSKIGASSAGGNKLRFYSKIIYRYGTQPKGIFINNHQPIVATFPNSPPN